MRTARFLPLSPSMHCWGGTCLRGCTWSLGVYLVPGRCTWSLVWGHVYLVPGGVPAGGVPGHGGCTCPGGYTCPRGCTCLGVYLPRGWEYTCQGVYLPGVYLPKGVPARGVPVQVLPPADGMTDRCKNITLP